VVDADALLVRTAEIPLGVIEAGKQLKVILLHGVGVDNIDVQAATENGAQVTKSPIANNTSVAEHILGLIVAVIALCAGRLRSEMNKLELSWRGRFSVLLV